jgi:hypothetical protein
MSYKHEMLEDLRWQFKTIITQNSEDEAKREQKLFDLLETLKRNFNVNVDSEAAELFQRISIERL